MSQFLGELVLKEIDEFGPVHEVVEPFGFASDLLQREILVPVGYRTDLASVPRLPFVYLVVGGRGNKAAVIHDYLYTSRITSRKQADYVFAEALRTTGYGRLVVGLMWSGVRLGGGLYWRDKPGAIEQPGPVAEAMSAASQEAP